MVKSLLPTSIVYWVAVFACMQMGIAQTYFAAPSTLRDTVYHTFSAKEYPTICLNNSTIYKLFGSTILTKSLPQSLSLTGMESAQLLPEYQQIWIAQGSKDVVVIDFSKWKDIQISTKTYPTPITHLAFDNYKTVFASGDSLHYSNTVTSEPNHLANLPSEKVSAADGDKQKLYFATFFDGVYALENTQAMRILETKGVTALNAKADKLWMVANGEIIQQLPNGSLKTYAALPDKYKAARQVAVDEDNTVYVLSENSIFVSNPDTKALTKLKFASGETPEVFNIALNGRQLHIATSAGLFTYLPTIDETLFVKSLPALPRLYTAQNDNIIVDDTNLLTTNDGKNPSLLAAQTKLEYPIPGNTGWWVKLGKKILKVGDRSMPPAPAPKVNINKILEGQAGNLFIATDDGMFNYPVANPKASTQVLPGLEVYDIFQIGQDSLLLLTPTALYFYEAGTCVALPSLEHRYIKQTESVQSQGISYLFACDGIALCRGTAAESFVSAKEDLLITNILSAVLVDQNLYILSPNQLLRLPLSELENLSSFEVSRYSVSVFEQEAQLRYLNDELYIETLERILYLSAYNLDNLAIPRDTLPTFSMDLSGDGIGIYDYAAVNRSTPIRYKYGNNDWENIEDNRIPASSNSKPLYFQKQNSYGEWVPRNPEQLYINKANSSHLAKWIALMALIVLVGILLVYFLIIRPSRRSGAH